MADDKVEIWLILQGLRQFVSGSKQASEAIEKTGTTAEKAGEKSKRSWKSMALFAGGAMGALYGAQRFVKSTSEHLTQLGKATIGLQRTTHLDAQTASAWVGVLKERNISTDQFRMALVKMSREMYLAQHGSKTAVQAFHDLGISQKLVASGNTEAVLEATSNAFERMGATSDRAALAQTMLGRGGVQLLPLLSKGKKAIQEQIGIQVKYHNTLSGKSVKSTMDMVQQQRELEAAYSGVQLQLGKALLPAMITVLGIILKIVDALQPLLNNSKLLTAVIIALAAAFVIFELAMVAATVASLAAEVALLPIIGIAAAIVVGLIAIGVAAYEVYKHWDWLKKQAAMIWGAIKHGVTVALDWIVQTAKTVWNWLKTNWPYLLGVLTGPFGLATVFVVKHFGQIKDFVLGVIDMIRRAFDRLVNWIKGLPGRIGHGALGLLKKIPGAGAIASGAGWVGSHLPFGQEGGLMTRSGGIVVGEAGPEVVNLPAGSLITPNSALAMGGGFTIEVPVFLDKREIARAIGQVTADKLARR